MKWFYTARQNMTECAMIVHAQKDTHITQSETKRDSERKRILFITKRQNTLSELVSCMYTVQEMYTKQF